MLWIRVEHTIIGFDDDRVLCFLWRVRHCNVMNPAVRGKTSVPIGTGQSGRLGWDSSSHAVE